jgi:hypothetical protein
VQSYGSRCVKPPVIFGDVARPRAMTVDWTVHAQSLSSRPMKGMLTGPITILQWSFVRDDQPRAHTALQIALAIRDEVADLEQAGIGIIQIDEPAIREGLPLRVARWDDYLAWATRAFRVAASVAADATQVHTHMCYSEFNDILPQIAAMDADVITIETSRSDMELLDGFGKFRYPNEIGPGVYDIHSPAVPSTAEMVRLLQKAAQVIPAAPWRTWWRRHARCAQRHKRAEDGNVIAAWLRCQAAHARKHSPSGNFHSRMHGPVPTRTVYAKKPVPAAHRNQDLDGRRHLHHPALFRPRGDRCGPQANDGRRVRLLRG